MRLSILFVLLTGCLGFIALPHLMRPPARSAQVESAISYFRTGSGAFAASCTTLRQRLTSLHPNDPQTLVAARQALIDCRNHYKQIESFLEYFFRSSATIYNRPPKFEAEEGNMEYQSPIGLQLIESLLYDPKPGRQQLLTQARAVESSAADLPALLYDLRADDRQLLASLRVELIRIMALDITGYEAPLLKSGIRESAEALQSLSFQLQPYLRPGEPVSDTLHSLLDKAIAITSRSTSFDVFDRLTFLTTAALPLQRQLNLFIRERGWQLNIGKVLNDDAPDLFSPDALLPDRFPGAQSSPRVPASSVDRASLLQLGKKLFSDSSLSGTGHKSCASCHNPAKAFTDGLPLSTTLDGHHLLDRNAPTLLYSGFQYNQFWDGRVHSLEQQIRTVLHDPREMGADTASLRQTTGLETDRIVTAIAAYVRSLHPMNSAFDKYMQGNAAALNNREKRGANLFMGKAQCATCHFIPLFNGLIPPDYALTEFEVLGTTSTDRLDQPHLSHDAGRYTLYPFPFFKGAFKTPTVRNAALTGPYMHNGAFRNLNRLMEFYNKGGGAGLGLPVPDQTLPASPLHLSAGEMGDIILFIRSLTDSLPQKS
jgi:cytochrome c peroxidase